MHYGRGDPEYTYYINSIELGSVTEEKDLSVLFHKDLKFSSHISQKINKANTMLAIIKRTFEYLHQEIFLRLFKALVRPHLQYANVVWYPHYKNVIEAVYSVQRRSTKLLPELRNLPYKERLMKLKLPTLAYGRVNGYLIQTYKIIHGFESIPMERCFVLSESRTRGHNFKLEKSRCNTTFRLNQFSQKVINRWNALSQHVMNAKTVNSFKSQLDKVYGDSIYEY